MHVQHMCCAVLCRAVPCHAVLCCALLCCAVLCFPCQPFRAGLTDCTHLQEDVSQLRGDLAASRKEVAAGQQRHMAASKQLQVSRLIPAWLVLLSHVFSKAQDSS